MSFGGCLTTARIVDVGRCSSLTRCTSRLQSIFEKTRGKVQVVLHGTNEFTPEILGKCIERGVTRVNANKLVLEDYNNYIAENTGKIPLTQVIEEGTAKIQKQLEGWMDSIGSSGKA